MTWLAGVRGALIQSQRVFRHGVPTLPVRPCRSEPSSQIEAGLGIPLPGPASPKLQSSVARSYGARVPYPYRVPFGRGTLALDRAGSFVEAIAPVPSP